MGLPEVPNLSHLFTEQHRWLAERLGDAALQALLPCPAEAEGTQGAPVHPPLSNGVLHRASPARGGPPSHPPLAPAEPPWRALKPGQATQLASRDAAAARMQCLRDLTHLYDALLSKSFTDRVLGSRLANGGHALAKEDGVLRRVAVAVQVRPLN